MAQREKRKLNDQTTILSDNVSDPNMERRPLVKDLRELLKKHKIDKVIVAFEKNGKVLMMVEPDAHACGGMWMAAADAYKFMSEHQGYEAAEELRKQQEGANANPPG